MRLMFGVLREGIHILTGNFNSPTSRIARNYGARPRDSFARAGTHCARRVPIFLGDEDADWNVGVVVEAIQSVRGSRRDGGAER